MEPVRVLFVCAGNICRSPMAEAIFRHLVAQRGLADRVHVDSAGTGAWHVGEPPHPRTQAVLRDRGISWHGQRARQVRPSDLQEFDYVLAMDQENLAYLERLARRGRPRGQVARLLDLVRPSPADGGDVPDPYYTGCYEEVYGLLRPALERLLNRIVQEHGLDRFPPETSAP